MNLRFGISSSMNGLRLLLGSYIAPILGANSYACLPFHST
jgi:hypothetical protein